jgi:hypothetical protein
LPRRVGASSRIRGTRPADVLQELTGGLKLLEGLRGVLGELVEEQHAAVRQRDLSGRAPSTTSLNYKVYISCLGLYCTASARCAASMRSLPARSAIVRASLRMRW